MTLAMGSKNVVVDPVAAMVYLSMTFFIERTAALLAFHEEAAADLVETRDRQTCWTTRLLISHAALPTG